MERLVQHRRFVPAFGYANPYSHSHPHPNPTRRPSQPRPTPVHHASLSPRPSSSLGFQADGAWRSFTLSANTRVRIVANPTGNVQRVEITANSGSANYCPPEQNDNVTLGNGGTVYLAGCVPGYGVVELRRDSDGHRLQTYAFRIAATPPPPTPEATPAPQCLPVSNVLASRTLLGNVYVRWQNPNGGLDATGRRVTIRKWQNNAWVFERDITVSDISIGTFHLGADHNTHFSYSVRSECAGGVNSAWSSWQSVGPFTDSATRDAPDNPDPTPTPEPATRNDDSGGRTDGPGDAPPPPLPWPVEDNQDEDGQDGSTP